MRADCEGCTVSVAAKQLRLREVEACELRVWMPAKDALIVEASDALRIGTWDVSYPQMEEQFGMAGMDLAGTNFWNKVYDFSPDASGQKHWEFLSPSENAQVSRRDASEWFWPCSANLSCTLLGAGRGIRCRRARVGIIGSIIVK